MPAASLAPIAGLAVVAILVGSTLLNGSPVVPPAGGSPAPTAIAMTTEDIAVLARNADGSLEVRTAGVGRGLPARRGFVRGGRAVLRGVAGRPDRRG